MSIEYDYNYIRYLSTHNHTFRLFGLDNAPLIISFLYQEFKKNNKIGITSSSLRASLTDYLYSINSAYNNIYTANAQKYLDDWSNNGLLRKYYPSGSDEIVFELTPAAEKALDWIRDLEKKEFVGTESRLLKIFEMLKEIVHKSSDDPQKRLDDLMRQKKQVEKEIQDVMSGNIERLSETQIKDRFMTVNDMARRLLSDFRQIELNFRELDRSIREKQINNNIKKGKLLDDVFKIQDSFILDTDQGKSFKAFWEFLIFQDKKDELSKLIETVNALPEVKKLSNDNFLENMEFNLTEAGEKVNKTNHVMIEQLRRYLADKTYLENKIIMEMINEFKSNALLVKDNPPSGNLFAVIDGDPDIGFIFDRPLYKAKKNPDITIIDIEEGTADSVDTDALYKHIYVDPEELKANIKTLLSNCSQVSLKDVISSHPVERGLAEVVTYVGIAVNNSKYIINDDVIETLVVRNRMTDKQYIIKMPQVVFCK